MLNLDKDALLCDLAETYHIYDYKSLPCKMVATFSCGLRADSRIKMKIAGIEPISEGYHDGSGKVSIDTTEKAKLVAKNIREGITILGVVGEMSGSEGMKPQSKAITPSNTDQTILPDKGYNCLSQVTVAKIPYAESENAAGGTTVTIG